MAGPRRSLRRPRAQAAHIAQTEAQIARSSPSIVQFHSGNIYIDRQYAEAMPLRVLNKHRGAVESHRLVVEQRAGECRQIVALEVRARIGDQGEARRVRFGKPVQRKRRDRVDDRVLRFSCRCRSSPCPRAAFLDLPHRCSERLNPMARRSSSASPPVKSAAIIAMRSSCSWNNGTPSVRASTGSSERMQRNRRSLALRAAPDKDAPFRPQSARAG